MKAFVKNILLAALLLVLTLLMALLMMFFYVYREPVRLVEHMEFGMTPREAERVLGVPSYDETVYIDVSDQTYRYQEYEAELLGYPATIRCEFARDWMRWTLWQCTIRLQDVPDEERLFQQIVSKLTEEMAGLERFYIHEHSGFNVSIGVNRGPVGTDYLISLKDKELTMICHCSEYMR